MKGSCCFAQWTEALRIRIRGGTGERTSVEAAKVRGGGGAKFEGLVKGGQLKSAAGKKQTILPVNIDPGFCIIKLLLG